MAQREKLEVKKRKLIGKKAKKIRKQGFILGNVYGPKVESFPVMVEANSFSKIFKS